MNDTDPQRSKAIGLDIGTSRVVSAQCQDADILFGTQLNAFTTIPYSKLTEGVLKKERIPCLVQEAEITVYGDESERFANLFHTETRRPMRSGVLNPDELKGAAMVRQIVSLVTSETNGRGRQVCVSIPAASLGAAESVSVHTREISKMLVDLGYVVRVIPEGLAVVYGELESSSYTGIGVSCGGGLCNVCLSYLSVPVVSFSIPKAGDFIDSYAANARAESATRIRTIKEESFGFNGHFPSKIHETICEFYDDMIQALVAAIRDAFASVQNLPKLGRPIPLVLAGGTALATGFRDRFEKVLRGTELPVLISEVRLASNPQHSTARGALVAAMSECLGAEA